MFWKSFWFIQLTECDTIVGSIWIINFKLIPMHLRNIWKLWNEQRWKCIILSIQKCGTATNFFYVYYAIHDLCSTLKMTFCEDILRAVVIWFRVYVSCFFILVIRYPIACKTMKSLDSTLAISFSNGCNTSIGSKRKKGGEKLYMKWFFFKFIWC